ncbi:uncharacterized protein DUF3833 [Vogesella indigofera]|uniref:Uncharacterized protein DUF3833 n=1 Tax=Vogesella indigofera TaxID=45465 RepID=A0A495BN19_VOGIN|nr:DUF3833 domain-containing protein [Vogesella indigofera]RKQ63038.1 uncharacterized protein DUF3833 [Vogesella indigofera]
MIRILKAAVLAALCGLLAACSSASIDDYRGTRPSFDLKTYFNGPVTAQGMFQDRSGKVLRRFSVQMSGSWQGDRGVLDEHFTYDDGEKQRRVWTLQKLPDGRYSGTASDVVGQASGRSAGFALFWDYTLRLPVDGTVYEVRFDDWMYQLDEHTVLNRSVMSKWGVRLGEVTLMFRKGAQP